MKKGAKSASSAGGLIAIITGLIILYILFLPSADRADLLNFNGTDFDRDSRDSSNNGTVLSETIGRVDFISDDDFEKKIPNLFLRERTSSEVIANFNPFVIRNGWFVKQKANVTFKINDLPNTNNIQLVFGAQTREGVLSIHLNNNKIFEGTVEEYNIDPVPLDKSLLDSENTLVFEVSTVGGRFWATNEYEFENARVIADVSDVSDQVQSTIFVMEGFEYFNLESARLVFVPFCRGVADVGNLEIHLNNNRIYDAIPLCEDRVVINVPIEQLNAGQNNLRFKTNRGAYAIEQIEMQGSLKDVSGVIEYFEISSDQYNDILDEDLEAILRLSFVEDDEVKRATININGHLNEIDQRGDEFNWTITNFVQEDSNFIKIDPKTTLDIVNLKVVLEEE